MYEVLYFSGDSVVRGNGGIIAENSKQHSSPNKKSRRQEDGSRPKKTNGSGARFRPEPGGAGAAEREGEGQQGRPRDASAKEAPLPPMTYDDSLTTSEACIDLWISAVLADKKRGDRLTKGECEILSTLGLEASWVQRMIDTATSPGRVCRSRVV